MLARRIVVALGVLSISSFAAMAADMPVKAPIVKAPAVMPFNWTGFYVGGNVGYGWLMNPLIFRWAHRGQ
jgi:outer membrane immunogenic protein